MPLRPTPSRENPRPALAFIGFFSFIVLAAGAYYIISGESVRGGIILVLIVLAAIAVLRVAWVVGTKRGL